MRAYFDREAACTAYADPCLHKKPDMFDMPVTCIDLNTRRADTCGAIGRRRATSSRSWQHGGVGQPQEHPLMGLRFCRIGKGFDISNPGNRHVSR